MNNYYLEDGKIYRLITNTDIDGNEFITKFCVGIADEYMLQQRIDALQAQLDDLNAQLDAINGTTTLDAVKTNLSNKSIKL